MMNQYDRDNMCGETFVGRDDKSYVCTADKGHGCGHIWEGRGTSVAEKGTLDGLPEASGKTWISSLRGGQGGWVSDSALRLAQTVLDQAHSHLRKHSSEEREEFQGLVLVDGKWVRL